MLVRGMTDTNDADQPGAEPDAVSVDSAVHDPVAAAILDALAAAKLGGSVSPEDVARAITFFSTPGAAGVTGNVLRICGGALIGA